MVERRRINECSIIEMLTRVAADGLELTSQRLNCEHRAPRLART